MLKTAVVIGATSGIGRELARQLVKYNYKVGITGRRIELLESLKNEKNDSYYISQFDVADSKEVNKCLEELAKKLNGVDMLILSSGTGEINTGLDFEIERKTINTNVAGFTCVIDWAFKYFVKQKSGHIVAITSLAGIRGSRETTSYNATKAYQINYLEGLRQKIKKLKIPIYITDVRPGFVNTAMAKGDKLFWVTPVKKAAQQILKAIRKRKSVAYISRRWLLIASILKFIPRNVHAKM